MKYFVVSDIHGYYDELITVLNEKSFDNVKVTDEVKEGLNYIENLM